LVLLLYSIIGCDEKALEEIMVEIMDAVMYAWCGYLHSSKGGDEEIIVDYGNMDETR